MTLHLSSEKLIALPVRLIETDEGAIIKRGNMEIRIPSKAVAAVLHTIFSSASRDGMSRQELLERFGQADRAAIRDLIGKLVAHRLLVPEKEYGAPPRGPESSLELFYWQLGERASVVSERLRGRRIAILGVNAISRQLAVALPASGVANFRVIDCPPLRNLRLFDDAGTLRCEEWPAHFQQPLDFENWAGDAGSWDCLVATSDVGEQEVFRDLNRLCVKRKGHFFPIILENLIGHVGPLVVPGETPCFECLYARTNSHLENPDMRKAVTHVAFEGQVVLGFHPTMASILADIAAFELIKFYGGPLSGYNVGTLIEVNLMATQVVARKVLKIPGCLVCSRAMVKTSITPHMNVFSDSIND